MKQTGLKPISVLVFAGAFIWITALACSSSVPPAAGEPSEENIDGLLKVVTTVSPITNIVENIGGTRVRVEGIVPEGTNSHTFEPAPSIARLMAEADLIVLNGLFLEEPSLQMAEANKRDDVIILTLADKTISPEEWVFDFSFPESDGHPNPHLWTDPILALKYSELVKDELVRLLPEDEAYFNENYQSFKTRIEDLDQRIIVAVETVPEQNRKLLTYHDSFPFFSQRYGMEIIGAVQPSDFTEPSAREVADLIDQVKETGVPAIFGSEVFPSPVMEQIAKEGGAEFIDQLRDDDLPGQSGDPDHSYLGLMVADVRIMVTALGGSAEALNEFDTGPVFEGDRLTIYPQ